MKKAYEYFVKAEELFVAISLAGVTFLIFAQAVARTVKHPINWGQDLALLLFPWIVFLGADLALREADFVSVDMITQRFPKKVQNFLYYLWYALILALLGIMAVNAFPIMQANYLRNYSAIGVSYNLAVMSVPVGATLMISTILIKLYKRVRYHEESEKMEGEF